MIDALRGGKFGLSHGDMLRFGRGRDNSDVVEKIYKIKQRLEEKPFWLLCRMSLWLWISGMGPQLMKSRVVTGGPLTVVGEFGYRSSVFGIWPMA